MGTVQNVFYFKAVAGYVKYGIARHYNWPMSTNFECNSLWVGVMNKRWHDTFYRQVFQHQQKTSFIRSESFRQPCSYHWILLSASHETSQLFTLLWQDKKFTEAMFVPISREMKLVFTFDELNFYISKEKAPSPSMSPLDATIQMKYFLSADWHTNH